MKIKHCTFCKNRKTIDCPNSWDCMYTDTKPFYIDNNILTKVSFLIKIILFFKKKHYSVDYDTNYASIITYKVHKGIIYVINEEIERVTPDD